MTTQETIKRACNPQGGDVCMADGHIIRVVEVNRCVDKVFYEYKRKGSPVTNKIDISLDDWRRCVAASMSREMKFIPAPAPEPEQATAPAPEPTPDIYADIRAEVARARGKFPKWPNDPVHAAAIIAEECGELQQAILENLYEPHKGGTGAQVRAEAIQTAAMCVRFLASMDARAYRWVESEQHKQEGE